MSSDARAFAPCSASTSSYPEESLHTVQSSLYQTSEESSMRMVIVAATEVPSAAAATTTTPFPLAEGIAFLAQVEQEVRAQIQEAEVSCRRVWRKVHARMVISALWSDTMDAQQTTAPAPVVVVTVPSLSAPPLAHTCSPTKPARRALGDLSVNAMATETPKEGRRPKVLISPSICEDSVSEDSQLPKDVVYPLNEEVEVPDTNGGLFKKVLVEGTGTKPVKGAKVSVHYVGTLEDGSKFDSSRDRGDLFEFALGKGQVIKGWDKGVATMRIGEKAVLRCSPEYGYGAAGSPPKIPANATLLFEVELFSWTREVDVSKAKDRSLMKDVLADGVDYENPSFETKVVMDVAVYSGAIDTSKPRSELPAPVWEKKQWEATLGEVELPPRLEECLHSMRNKESAAFRVKGSLVPEAVPAFHIPSEADRSGADVTYLVEMHAMHSIKSWEFEGEAKIAEGLARKDKGNAALKENRLDLAERYYRRALEFVGEDYGLKDECKPACHQARIAVCGNLTQVLLQKAQYHEALTFCEKVLALEPTNAKALFRFAKAKDALQDWEAAAKAVDKILEGDANNADAIALKQHIASEKKAYDQKQKSLFKRMFS